VSFLQYEYTATLGQTTFSGADDNSATLSYTVANLIVTLNGVVLDNGGDYTATNGTSVVLTSGAAAGDLLQVIAFKSFTVADMVPASTGGTFAGNVAVNGNLTVDTNTLFVDAASNNVGIGTTSPSSLLHASGAAASSGSVEIRLEDTAASSNSRLMRTGSAYSYAGVGANETWLYHAGAGTINIGPDGAGAVKIVNNGSERARIDSSGNLLVGGTATNPGQNNTTVGTAFLGAGRFMMNNSSSDNIMGRNSDGTLLSIRRSGNEVGSISVTASATAFNTSSDYRLKEDVQPMVGASDRLMALKPVNFAWKVDGTRVDGFLAHEAQEVVPEAVTGSKDAVDKDGKPQYQGIDQSKIVPLLTAALQEALTKIEQLEARMAILEGGAA
jgi:hypothetical protein